MNRAAEMAALTIAGAVLGALVGRLIDLAIPGAVIAGLNGAIGGWRRIYHWRSPSGPLAFVLDSTWALVTTTAALVAHAVAMVQRDRGGYLAELSQRCDRHVYASGLRVRPGFLLATGNVVNGARGTTTRRHTVVAHEHVHVWQARWFGPAFPLIYGLWLVLGALLGTAAWLFTRRRDRWWMVVDTWAYYSNPFEWWAYSREGRWPSPGAVERHTWRKPANRPRSTD